MHPPGAAVVRLAAALGDPADPDPRRWARPTPERRVRRRPRPDTRRDRRHGRRDGVRRPLRHRPALRRADRGGTLRGLAARPGPGRRPLRLGERAVERRRRASPLHGAALDGPRRRVGGAPAPPAHAAARARRRRPRDRLRDRGQADERGRRRSCSRCSSPGVTVCERPLPYALGGLVSLPLVVAYWPKGYVGMFDGAISATSHPWAALVRGRRLAALAPVHATLLLLLAPLFVVGCFAVRDRWVLLVVCTPIVVNAVVYSFYYVTALHPRFLYVTLPSCFVLEAAGAVCARRRPRAPAPLGAAGTRSVSVERRPAAGAGSIHADVDLGRHRRRRLPRLSPLRGAAGRRTTASSASTTSRRARSPTSSICAATPSSSSRTT